MIELILQYYTDEKNGFIPALVAAILFLILGSLLFFKFSGNALAKGMGTGFLVVAALLFVMAVSTSYYNNNKIKSVRELNTHSETALRQSEITRMDKVMNVTFRYAFISFAVLMIIALSIILFTKSEFWKGIGISLMILVALAIIFDSFNMQRNRGYQQQVTMFNI